MDIPVPIRVNPVWYRSRERVFTIFVRYAASIGLVALGIAQRNAFLSYTFIIFSIFLVLLWGLSAFRNINYEVRAQGFLFIIFCISVFETLNYGFSLECFTFFMTFVVAAGVLTSRRATINSLLLTLIALGLFDYLIGYGIFIPIVRTTGYAPSTLVSGLTNIAVFAACGSSISAAIVVLTENLNEAWLKEADAHKDLQMERDHLEQRVKDRTRDLSVARDKANKDSDELRTYFHAIEQSGNTIIILDLDGKITYVNPKFSEVTGYLSSEVLGSNISHLLSSESSKKDFRDETWWKNVNEGMTWYGEFQNRRKDGTIIWESAVIAPVQDQDGKIINFIEIKQDISGQKILEQQLQQQNDYFSILQEIALDLLNRRDMEELLQVIVNRSLFLLDASYSELLLEDNGVLVLQAASGEISRQVKGERISRDQSTLSWQTFDKREPMVLNDYATWPDHRREYDTYHLHAVAEFPILIGDQCVGVLSLGRDIPDNPFAAEQVQTGIQFARFIALVLDNAKLYKSAMDEIAQRKDYERRLFNQNQYLAVLHQTAVEMLQSGDEVDTLLDKIVNNAAELVGAPYGIIFLTEGDDLVSKAATGGFKSSIGAREKKPGAGVLQKVWNDLKPFVVADYTEWEENDPAYRDLELHAIAGVPIVGRSGLLGVLEVARMGDDHQIFVPQETEILIQFAVFASMILDNTQLYEDARNEIAERKRAEIMLQESENRFRQIVENASDVIYRTDTNGNFVYVNPTAVVLMGYQNERDVLGRNYLDLILPVFKNDVKKFYLRQFVAKEKNTYYEFPVFNAHGDVVWFGQNVQLIEDDGKINGFQAVARDITKLREIQEALTLSRDQALAASRFKSRLVSLVSHELRTPLGGILGFAELLRYKAFGSLNEKQEDAVINIIQSSNFLTETINNLLDQAQVESKSLTLRYEYFDPLEMVERTGAPLSVLANKKELSFSIEVSPDLPRSLYGDKNRIQQIITNLTGNAIKFTKQGSVNVRIFSSESAHWSIEVSDTGAGIPADEFENIFEPFKQIGNAVTIENKGSGLGLSIVKQLVELMNGSIDLESEVGVGTTFVVTLPLL